MPAPEKDPTWRCVRGWMVLPHSINLLLYFSGSPHSPFLHLFLSRFMKGRGGGRGEGAILAGPLCSSRGKRPLGGNSPSSLLIPYLTRLPSVSASAAVVVGRLVPLSTPSNALPLVHRWFTHPVSPCLPVSCLSVCLSRLSLSLLCLFRGNSREGGEEGGAPFARPRFL